MPYLTDGEYRELIRAIDGRLDTLEGLMDTLNRDTIGWKVTAQDHLDLSGAVNKIMGLRERRVL